MTDFSINRVSAESVLSLRTRYRCEANGQLVHDSLHSRSGWTETFLFRSGSRDVGFGSVAVAGPWHGKPTIFEFYLLPDWRCHAFELFEAFLDASKSQYFEVQTSDTLLHVMMFVYASEFQTESIVFFDHQTTEWLSQGSVVACVTPRDIIQSAIEQRAGGAEWILSLGGKTVGKGGVLFHYNRPFGDIYMEIDESYRKCGLGSYLVQEIKKATYELGAVPCARCNPSNLASRRTLQKAGFVPYAHIVNAIVKSDVIAANRDRLAT